MINWLKKRALRQQLKREKEAKQKQANHDNLLAKAKEEASKIFAYLQQEAAKGTTHARVWTENAEWCFKAFVQVANEAYAPDLDGEIAVFSPIGEFTFESLLERFSKKIVKGCGCKSCFELWAMKNFIA